MEVASLCFIFVQCAVSFAEKFSKCVILSISVTYQGDIPCSNQIRYVYVTVTVLHASEFYSTLILWSNKLLPGITS